MKRIMKGISPLISAVLLIAIVVLAAGVIFSWISSTTREETRRISNKTSEVVSCGNLIIDDVYLDFDGDTGRVFVKSMDAVDQIVSAELISITGTRADILTQLPTSISKGEVKLIEFDNITDKIGECGNFSKALISTRCISDEFGRPLRSPHC